MDLNEDGNKDILSGSYSRMSQDMAGLFQVLWGQEDGSFQKAQVLQGTDDEPLIIPIEDRSSLTECICTRPTAVDWDSDGDLDLIVGNFAGSFYLFEGKGKGVFLPTPEKIMIDGRPLKINGAHSDPFMVDWDGDGDLDLLSGSSSGGVQWSENQAGADAPPELSEFKRLIEPANVTPRSGQVLRETDLSGPTRSTRIWVDDVTGDGKLDILVGDTVTLVSPAEGVTEEEVQERYAQWRKDVSAASRERQSATDPDDPEKRKEAYERFRKVYDQRKEFMVEDRTGFVWLYARR